MIGLRLVADQRRHHAHRREHHHEADHRGERGDAVVAGEPERDADREDERQVAEDGAARLRHHVRHDRRQPGEVRAADAEEDAGHRQHRDRQHQRLADLLQPAEGGAPDAHAGPPRSDARADQSRAPPQPSAASSASRARLAALAPATACAPAPSPPGQRARSTLSSSTPSPISTGTACGSPASRAADADPPPLRVRAGRRSARSGAAPTDGARRPAGASPGWVRSIASVYWVRSFVPMEKKSASRAKRSARSAAAGVSIMMPTGNGGTPSASALALHQLRARRATPPCVEIIGNMIADFAGADARRMARTWAREDLRAVQQQPDAALAEERVRFGGHRQVGQRLVAADVERADDEEALGSELRGRSPRRPPPARPRSARSGGPGTGTRSAAGRRLRRRPRRTRRASSTSPMFATTSTRWPSLVTAGSAAAASSARAPSRGGCLPRSDLRLFGRQTARAAGCRRRRRGLRGVPEGSSSTRGSMPATAGMPSAARQDGDVRRGAARRRAEAAHARAVERRGVGRGQVLGDDDRLRRAPRAARRRDPRADGARAGRRRAGRRRAPRAARCGARAAGRPACGTPAATRTPPYAPPWICVDGAVEQRRDPPAAPGAPRRSRPGRRPHPWRAAAAAPRAGVRAGDRRVERAPLVALIGGALLGHLVVVPQLEHAADRDARARRARPSSAAAAEAASRRAATRSSRRGAGWSPWLAAVPRPRPTAECCHDGCDRRAGIFAARDDGHGVAAGHLERHDGHDAAGVRLAIPFHQPRSEVKRARRRRDRRGGTRVQSRLARDHDRSGLDRAPLRAGRRLRGRRPRGARRAAHRARRPPGRCGPATPRRDPCSSRARG